LNGKQIKRLRETLGDTTLEFAERLGVSQRSINKWENGGTKVTAGNAAKLKELQQSLGDVAASTVEVAIGPDPTSAEPKQRKPRKSRNMPKAPPGPHGGSHGSVGTDYLLQATQAFHDARRARLVDDALTYAVGECSIPKAHGRKLITLFLHLVGEEAPAEVMKALRTH
jgi:transcriptional regulator with XRE-family HTH domain